MDHFHLNAKKWSSRPILSLVLLAKLGKIGLNADSSYVLQLSYELTILEKKHPHILAQTCGSELKQAVAVCRLSSELL